MPSNLDKRIDVFIDMLSEDKYTTYEAGKPNNTNILRQNNKVPFKGYESIAGLNTSQFWCSNSLEYIIPLLFYNMQYDSKEKKFIESDKDYSGSEYDKARQNVLTYLSTKKEKLESIEDYIDKLALKEKKTKKVQNLIDLRNNLRDKDIRIRIREEACIKENIELNNIYNTTTRRAM